MKLLYTYSGRKVEITINESDLFWWASGCVSNKTGRRKMGQGMIVAKLVREGAGTVKGLLK